MFDRASEGIVALAFGFGALLASAGATEPGVPLRLAFFGDSGTGGTDQKAVARQLRRFEDELRHVYLLGDNVYWTGREDRLRAAFHRIYARLLEARRPDGSTRVRFHAALGNHDAHECALAPGADGGFARDRGAYRWDEPGCDVERQLADPAFGYPDGLRYYRVDMHGPDGAPLAEAFVLDSNTLPSAERPERRDTAQLEWLDTELRASRARAAARGDDVWRIVTLHRPLRTPAARGYAFGKGGHEEEGPFLDALRGLVSGRSAAPGADPALRRELDAAVQGGGVDAVFSGHNHFYARIRPGPDGTRFFVSGGGGVAVYEPERDAELAAGGGFHHFVTVLLDRGRFEYCVVDSLGRVRDHGFWTRATRADPDRPLPDGRYDAVCRP